MNFTVEEKKQRKVTNFWIASNLFELMVCPH